MLKWDIRDTDIGKLKDKWISYAGERWRAFKTSSLRHERILPFWRKERGGKWFKLVLDLVLQCQRQSFDYESGYYVMIHMLNIVSAGFVNSWNQVFGDSTPFHDDEVLNVQERCANSILEFV
ncbi:hypothetical protein P8452_61269 [Trifolium repens]|nr:hypothetical protein P8452_61269 [Trifolium repens]